jgi:hypothetical protein
MAKNTSILLGDYFDNFINQQERAENTYRQAKLSELQSECLNLRRRKKVY